MAQPTGTIGYQERLRVPWRWWLPAIAIAAVLASPFVWGPVAGPIGYAAPVMLIGGTIAGLWWLGRVRVAVVDDELLVDDARLPVRYVSQAIPLDATGRQELLGPGADPLAFVVQRPWLPGAVQVVLDDPADPTPYWLISSRRPAALAAALSR
ncbi:DUF3093 domain-containing protein [Natronosporangium hydrolyticum]|uniref:DUF3093 domain-containing protein n=1 Tax=Natronosporangium hydrolyticum TaxID=2811111 RepID=A0A895YD31_9ACTN|nr:DUF3093 domain-containing protein [Natronosporangium hydrolyticum]QSB13363.1 DUF3093 domain-containing protein [Natronosporangium hydrolyticum]